MVPAVDANADPNAEIVSITGDGQFRQSDVNQWIKAFIEHDLFNGNLVRTGRLSRMGILFKDRTQIRLHQKTILRIKTVSTVKDTPSILRLNRGRARSQSKTLPGGLLMETPSATAAIRGTDWELEVDDNDISTLTVLSGKVSFYNDLGSFTVFANEQARAEPGKAPVKLVVVQPSNRVQWVSTQQVNPLHYFSAAESVTSLKKVYQALKELRLEEVEQLLKLIEAESESDRAIQELANISLLILNSRLADAVSSLEHLVMAADPQSDTARLLLSQINVYLGDLPMATALVNQVIQSDADNSLALAQLARIKLISGSLEESQTIVEQALDKNPDSYDLNLVLGDILRLQGQADHAIQAYTKASVLRPDDSRAWHGLGVIETERENVAIARKHLVHALNLDSRAPGYSGQMGTLETLADNFRTAGQSFDTALSENPADYVALTGLGISQLKQGRNEQALLNFLRAGLLEPRYARVHVYSAIAYYRLGHIDQALEELDLASRLDEKDPLPHMMRSIIQVDQLRPGDALADARRAVELIPYL